MSEKEAFQNELTPVTLELSRGAQGFIDCLMESGQFTDPGDVVETALIHFRDYVDFVMAWQGNSKLSGIPQ
jgi:hypothetical protein